MKQVEEELKISLKEKLNTYRHSLRLNKQEKELLKLERKKSMEYLESTIQLPQKAH